MDQWQLYVRLYLECTSLITYIDAIKKGTYVIESKETISFDTGSLADLQEELPSNTPRFILLSYTVSGQRTP